MNIGIYIPQYNEIITTSYDLLVKVYPPRPDRQSRMHKCLRLLVDCGFLIGWIHLEFTARICGSLGILGRYLLTGADYLTYGVVDCGGKITIYCARYLVHRLGTYVRYHTAAGR